MKLLQLMAVTLSTQLTTSVFADEHPTKVIAYVGTYTGGESKGIYQFELDLKTGKATAPKLAADVANPSFLAIHPNQKYLYAVGELSDFEGKKGGAVSAFSIDRKSGKLNLLNQESSVGAGPCHLVVDGSGKNVLVANYGGGSVASLPIDAKGRVGEASSFIQHEGSSVNPRRQKGPHAHSITWIKRIDSPLQRTLDWTKSSSTSLTLRTGN